MSEERDRALIVVRWVAFFPLACVASMAASAFWALFTYFQTWLFGSSNSAFIKLQLFGLGGGCAAWAFVAAASAIVPSRKRTVAIVMATATGFVTALAIVMDFREYEWHHYVAAAACVIGAVLGAVSARDEQS